MKLFWADFPPGTGPSFGYSRHNEGMKAGLRAAGADLTFDREADADLAIVLTSPDRFRPVPGRRTILITTCEMDEPTLWCDAVSEAVALVCPCEHNKAVFAKHYRGPIFVVPEGVDSELYHFHERTQPAPDQPFLFLFNGHAEDCRKGVPLVITAWKAWHKSGRMPKNAQLVVHTTGEVGPIRRLYLPTVGSPSIQYYSAGQADGVFIPLPDSLPGEYGVALEAMKKILPNMILDTRILSEADLIELYKSAHCLMAPSYGEAWNLPAGEAAAIGLPVVFTAFGGPLDYLDESCAYPLTDFEMVPMNGGNVSWPLRGARASEAAIIEAMESVYDDYGEALTRGRRAAERMTGYTWLRAGQLFLEICRNVAQPGVTGAK